MELQSGQQANDSRRDKPSRFNQRSVFRRRVVRQYIETTSRANENTIFDQSTQMFSGNTSTNKVSGSQHGCAVKHLENLISPGRHRLLPNVGKY
jgi:hypothetical protein